MTDPGESDADLGRGLRGFYSLLFQQHVELQKLFIAELLSTFGLQVLI